MVLLRFYDKIVVRLSCLFEEQDTFQEQLNSILAFLAKAETVDNRVLIELEKFYQTSSLLMGLSALNPDALTRAAWRAYDRFHFDQVKTKLSLYGPTIIL